MTYAEHIAVRYACGDCGVDWPKEMIGPPFPSQRCRDCGGYLSRVPAFDASDEKVYRRGWPADGRPIDAEPVVEPTGEDWSVWADESIKIAREMSPAPATPIQYVEGGVGYPIPSAPATPAPSHVRHFEDRDAADWGVTEDGAQERCDTRCEPSPAPTCDQPGAAHRYYAGKYEHWDLRASRWEPCPATPSPTPPEPT